MARSVTWLLLVLLASTLCIAQETIKSPEGPKLHVYHKRGNDYIKRGEIVGLFHAPEYKASESFAATLEEPKDDLYQIKIRDEETDRIMLSTVKYSQLVTCDWYEEFRIHLDDQNQVYHVDYYAVTRPDKDVPKTSIKVLKPTYGPKPALGQFGGKKSTTKSERPVARGEGGEEPVEEEKSFFQKYWYLLLAGVLILLSSSAPPPENNGR